MQIVVVHGQPHIMFMQNCLLCITSLVGGPVKVQVQLPCEGSKLDNTTAHHDGIGVINGQYHPQEQGVGNQDNFRQMKRMTTAYLKK